MRETRRRPCDGATGADSASRSHHETASTFGICLPLARAHGRPSPPAASQMLLTVLSRQMMRLMLLMLMPQMQLARVDRGLMICLNFSRECLRAHARPVARTG